MNHGRRAEPNSRTAHYARFSEREFERRRSLVREMMDEEGYDALVIYGNAAHEQVNVQYLSNYQPPYSTYLVFFADPDEKPTLFVGLSNHLQYVREKSIVDDLRLMRPNPPSPVVDRLEDTDAARGTIGIVGHAPRYKLSVPYPHYEMFEAELQADLRDATAPYLEVHSVKSDEEIDIVRKATAITDEGLAAMVDAVEPGVSENELAVQLRTTYGENGATAASENISSAPMVGAEPGACLPWKTASSRTVDAGDVVTTEIGASMNGYSGQIHRPIAVDRDPSDDYREMFELAKETYENMLGALSPGNTTEDVYQAVGPIENSAYRAYDVMFHGYGNGYLQPFVGTSQTDYWPGVEDPVTEQWVFEEGMVVVVQPNLVSDDERRGLQLGTTAVVRESGPEVLHDYPVEFVRT